MDIAPLILSGLIILATHFVGAIAAYGSTLLALPMLAYMVDLRTAVTALLLVGTVQAYHVAFYTYRHLDRAELLRILLWMGMGLPIGFLSASILPQTPLLIGLGVVLLTAGASRLLPGSREIPRPVLRLLLFIGGIIHGAFVCGGATLVVYAQHSLKDKGSFRGTLTMVWVILNTGLVTSAFLKGSITPSVGRLALVGLPFCLLGNWLGEHTARRIEQRRFMQLVAVLLMIGGALTIARVL